MSRIGKQPIPIPENVEVTIENDVVKMKGPKGELTQSIHPAIEVGKNKGVLNVRPKSGKGSSALWGLTRALVFNMTKGITEGYHKKLEIEGIGFRAQVQGNVLTLYLGFSHPVEYSIPDEVTVTVAGNTIEVFGADKYMVGQVAAKIRALKKPEPYKGKGIHYVGERIRRKAGKKTATQER